MQKLYFSLSIFILTSLAACAPSAAVQPAEGRALENPTPKIRPEIVSHDPPASCPVTLPQEPLFTAPEPYSPNAPFDYGFWFGSESLWTLLPKDGIWYSLPHNPGGYTQKVFWWRQGYIWNEEPQPDLSVTGERLDAAAPPLIVSRATNAYADDIGSSMLVGVDFPNLGCWKITGQYADAQLSFVVWVAP